MRLSSTIQNGLEVQTQEVMVTDTGGIEVHDLHDDFYGWYNSITMVFMIRVQRLEKS